jgi:hypothetical protein
VLFLDTREEIERRLGTLKGLEKLLDPPAGAQVKT